MSGESAKRADILPLGFCPVLTIKTTTMQHKPVKNLLSKGSTNVKTAKNALETFILYMAPAETALRGFNLCPYSSEGCRKSCLYTAGRGRFSNVQLSRINKSLFWIEDIEQFYFQLAIEIQAIHRHAQKTNTMVAIRLNGTSDIDHLAILKRKTGNDFLSQPYVRNILFYDYTKNPNHIRRYLNTPYKLTFSRSEVNEADALEILKVGGNVAAVFNELPASWNGFPVINGDETDLRYYDPSGVVVGLKAKGDAKKDMTGFVIR